ncbi:hypothetical protein ACFLTK_03740 [Chloroflexota bacterium]
MKGKLVWSVFWALVGVFVTVVSMFLITRSLMPFSFVSAGVIFALLSVALLFLTVKTKVGGILKKFLLLTGASAMGIPVSIFLHNVIYGIVYIKMLNMPDLDEPFFFIMAVFVCPLGFLVGVVGTIVLTIKNKPVEQSSENS